MIRISSLNILFYHPSHNKNFIRVTKIFLILLFSFCANQSYPQLSLDWVRYYHSGAVVPKHEQAISLCLDNEKNIYVAGSGANYTYYGTYVMLKYSPSGNLEWQAYNSNGIPNMILFNGSNAFFVSGSDGLLKLTSSGYVSKIRSGNYARIFIEDGNLFSYCYNNLSILEKHDLEGNTIWARNFTSYYFNNFSRLFKGAGNKLNVAGSYSVSYPGPPYYYTGYNLLTFDSLGNSISDMNLPGGSVKEIGDEYSNSNFFAGYAQVSSYHSYLRIYKLSQNNSILDTFIYNGAGNGKNEPYDIISDGMGHIYVACKSTGVGVDLDFVVLKFDTNGNLLWEYRFNGTQNAYDAAQRLRLDNNGNICATGVTTMNSLGIQIYTVKLSSSGALIWSDKFGRYNTSNDSNYVSDLQLDNLSNIYICGKSYNSTTSKYDFLTLKYSDPTKINNQTESVNDFDLLQNYPNPFNPVTNIKFSLFKASSVRINIYDISGKKVSELINAKYPKGQHSVKWGAESFASGVYFISLETDDFKKIRKAVLNK